MKMKLKDLPIWEAAPWWRPERTEWKKRCTWSPPGCLWSCASSWTMHPTLADWRCRDTPRAASRKLKWPEAGHLVPDCQTPAPNQTGNNQGCWPVRWAWNEPLWLRTEGQLPLATNRSQEHYDREETPRWRSLTCHPPSTGSPNNLPTSIQT